MLKSFYSLIFVLVFQVTSYAQPYLDFGIKGSYGWNFLINSNIMDDDSLNHQISFGYAYGGKFGFNFSPNHEITFDVMLSKFRQKFEYLDPTYPTKKYHFRCLEFSAMDLLVMYRNNLDDGTYFEIGPQLSLLKSSIDIDKNPAAIIKEIEVNEFLNPKYTSMVMGFGGYIIGTENFSVGLGLRIKYSPFDLLSEKGKDSFYPRWKAYDSHKPFTPLTMELVLEINYEIFLVSSTKKNKNCKSRVYHW